MALRIAMMCDSFLPLIGGGEIHVAEMSRALTQLGHNVEVHTFTKGPECSQGIWVRRYPLPLGGGRRAYFAIRSLLPTFRRSLRQYDIIHCHYTYLMAATACVAAKTLGIPSCVTLHGLGTLDSSVKKKLFMRMLRYTAFKCCDRVIATSEEMKSIATRFRNERDVSLITNGVDTDYFRPGKQSPQEGVSRKPVVLSVRRLAPKNGVQYLVEAIPHVLKRVPDTEFWLTGADKLEGYIKRRCHELGVVSNVRFLGLVDHDRTREYYAQADVVAFPSSAESTSLACLEALSMGRAVVASSLGAYRKMLVDGQYGRLVRLFDRESSDYDAPLSLPADRIEELAGAITELLLNREMRQDLGQRAREHVIRSYDWKAIARSTVSLYEDILRGR